MPKLTALDETSRPPDPEPLPNVVTHHEHWRESYFFIVHPRDRLGDVVDPDDGALTRCAR